MKLTENEKILLKSVVFDQYHDGRHPVMDPVWTDSVKEVLEYHFDKLGKSRRSISGVFGSAARKGLIVVDDNMDDPTVAITQAGFDAFIENGGKY